MLKSEHLHKDLNDLVSIEKDLTSPFERAMVRIGILTVKLLVNIRQNQVQDMIARNIPTLKNKNTAVVAS